MPKLETVPAGCPNQVLELVEALRQSGTGKPKLRRLLEIGAKCSGSEEFLAAVKKEFGEGTVKKIVAYIESKGPPEPAKEEGPVKEESVEVTTESVEEPVKEEETEPSKGKGKKSK